MTGGSGATSTLGPTATWAEALPVVVAAVTEAPAAVALELPDAAADADAAEVAAALAASAAAEHIELVLEVLFAVLAPTLAGVGPAGVLSASPRSLSARAACERNCHAL